MTLGELRAAVIDNTRRSDKATLIDRAINLAGQEISQLEPFASLRSEIEFVLLANTNQVIVGSIFSQIVEVRLLPPPDDDTNDVPSDPSALNAINIGYEVIILDQRTLQKRFPNLQANSRGIPEYCFVTNGNVLNFIPPSSLDRTCRILVDAYAQEMNDDEDTTPLPTCDNAIIAWASRYVFMSLGLVEDALIWQQEYAKAIRIAMDSNDKRTGQLRQMRGATTTRPRYIDPRINHYTRQTYGDISS